MPEKLFHLRGPSKTHRGPLFPKESGSRDRAEQSSFSKKTLNFIPSQTFKRLFAFLCRKRPAHGDGWPRGAGGVKDCRATTCRVRLTKVNFLTRGAKSAKTCLSREKRLGRVALNNRLALNIRRCDFEGVHRRARMLPSRAVIAEYSCGAANPQTAGRSVNDRKTELSSGYEWRRFFPRRPSQARKTLCPCH